MPRILFAVVEPLACIAYWAYAFAALLFILALAAILDPD